MYRVLTIIALWSTTGLACPWHGEWVPALEGDSYKELTLLVEDHLSGTKKEYIVDADGFMVKDIYGYNCMLSPHAHGSGLDRELTCQRGDAAREVTTIACDPYQEDNTYAEWTVADKRGMKILSIKMSCATTELGGA